MFRYVAANWDTRSEAQSAAARDLETRIRVDSPEWAVILRAPGFVLYTAGLRPGSSDIYSLADGTGVVLGALFNRIDDSTGECGKAELSAAETRRVKHTRGESLARDFWGRYVAFITSADDRSLMVMRSPTGELDCLHTEIFGVRVFFSNPRHCPLLSLRNFSINWDYVCTDLATLVPDTRETGIVEVERILRGECITWRAGAAERSLHWNPLDFVDERLDDPVRAASELRRTVFACVDTWASCYKSVMPLLSGGLDSSIVVELLKRAHTRPKTTCLNYYNRYDAISDERRYARIVAADTNYPLIEREQPPTFSLDAVLDMPPAISPCLNIYGLGDIHGRAELARSCQTDAWFLGHGGDQVFFTGAGHFSCKDFTHQYGLRSKLLAVALDASRITHRALWPTLGEGIRERFAPAGIESLFGTTSFLPLLRADVLERVSQRRLFVPSWLDTDRRVPPGKGYQVLTLSVTDVIHSPYAPEDDPESVSPLLSQPVQELCLRIPTHVLVQGGRDRGLARLAFANDLPPEIARRQTKSGVFDYVKAIWLSNQSFVSDLLMDGVLCREGIVDKSKLTATLARSFESDFSAITRMASLASAEAWARSWGPMRQRAAA